MPIPLQAVAPGEYFRCRDRPYLKVDCYCGPFLQAAVQLFAPFQVEVMGPDTLVYSDSPISTSNITAPAQ